uniref:Uncharacterized protein n=1 Tax=Ditylenchus dipsaci TaxID=166011 RepID=A0A915D973_9BILA
MYIERFFKTLDGKLEKCAHQPLWSQTMQGKVTAKWLIQKVEKCCAFKRRIPSNAFVIHATLAYWAIRQSDAKAITKFLQALARFHRINAEQQRCWRNSCHLGDKLPVVAKTCVNAYPLAPVVSTITAPPVSERRISCCKSSQKLLRQVTVQLNALRYKTHHPEAEERKKKKRGGRGKGRNLVIDYSAASSKQLPARIPIKISFRGRARSNQKGTWKNTNAYGLFVVTIMMLSQLPVARAEATESSWIGQISLLLWVTLVSALLGATAAWKYSKRQDRSSTQKDRILIHHSIKEWKECGLPHWSNKPIDLALSAEEKSMGSESTRRTVACQRQSPSTQTFPGVYSSGSACTISEPIQEFRPVLDPPPGYEDRRLGPARFGRFAEPTETPMTLNRLAETTERPATSSRSAEPVENQPPREYRRIL